MRNIKKVTRYDLEIILTTKCNEKIRFNIYDLNDYGLQNARNLTDTEILLGYTHSINFIFDGTLKFYFKTISGCYVNGYFKIKDTKDKSEIFNFLIESLGSDFCTKYNLSLTTSGVKMDPIENIDDIHHFLIHMADQI